MLRNYLTTLIRYCLLNPKDQLLNISIIYGKDLYYATFKKNKHTQWYVFFNVYEKKEETIYLVRYISNNHVISQYL